MSRASYRGAARAVTVQEEPHRSAEALPNVTRPAFLAAESPSNLERQSRRESRNWVAQFTQRVTNVVHRILLKGNTPTLLWWPSLENRPFGAHPPRR